MDFSVECFSGENGIVAAAPKPCDDAGMRILIGEHAHPQRL
jgi:hypothetical protein